MSYILEALKKSQAERQLGNAPTIHALPIDMASQAPATARRDRLWLALAAGALLLATAALLTWRQHAQPPAPVQPVQAVPSTAPVVQAPAPPVQLAPPAPPPVALAAPPAPARPVAPKAVPQKKAPPADAASAAPAEPAEEEVRLLRELPAEIQREVPQLAIGGYIYSRNPADRLLLIDKVLRHEGEQIGPNLTLEKLQRNGAVMNFRGYRYRVPY